MTRAMRLMFALVLALQAPAALAGKRVKPDLVEDALAFAANGDREKAARSLEDAIANDATLSDDQRDILRLHAAEQRRLLGQRDAAWDLYRAVVDGGRPGASLAGTLGITLLDAERGMDAALAERLAAPDEREVIATQNADRYLLLAIFANGVGDEVAFKEASRKAQAFAREDGDVLVRVRTALDALEGRPAAGDRPAAEGPRSPLAKAEEAWSQARREDALRLADEAIALAPDSDDARAAAYLKRKVEGNWAPDPQKIGVLLPLSGKYLTVGQQIQKALELGYGAGSRRLVFVDNGETAETAQQALEKLVFEDRVIAVVGPLRTEGALEVARAADAMRVPLVSLAQTTGLTDSRPWVLQGTPTPADQVHALLDFVMTTKGMDAFGIFAPDSPYGHLAADVFEAEVTQRGGTIAIKGFYDSAAMNVGPAAQVLGRKDYEARNDELTELRKQTKENGGDPARVVLPPIVDFDAMFVPDSASRVPIACAGLAYEEFPMGDFKPTKASVPFPMLGLSGWNSDNLITTGGPYLRGGYFTDVYRAGTDPAFEEKFRAGIGHTPSAIEATAYDLGALLARTAAGPAKTTAEFRDALLATKLDSAATGTDAFAADTRNAEHHVRIYQVTAKAIVEIDPTPPAPVPDTPLPPTPVP